jgi:tripeptidyl-peptidase-1
MTCLLFIFILITYTQATLLRRESVLGLSDWTWGYEADMSQWLQISIALRVQDTNLAVETLLRISDPASPEYGQYLSATEVARLFKPNDNAIPGVLKWLSDSGIDQSYISFSYGGSHLSLYLPTQKAALLLQTTFYHQIHPETRQERIACQYYHIPQPLTESIDYILTTTSIPTHQQTPQQQIIPNDKVNAPAPLLQDCHEISTLGCLRALYGIPQDVLPHPNNSFGIFEPSWYSWRPEDLDMFFEAVNKSDLMGRRPKIDAINGGYLQREKPEDYWYREPDLDFEYAMALVSPHEVTNIEVGSQNQIGNLKDMLAAFDRYYCDPVHPDHKKYPPSYPSGCNTTHCECGSLSPPKVLSISWGWPEAAFTSEYIQRQCIEFLKLGLMGTTVIASVSDHGTASGGGAPCIDDEIGNGTSGRFSPTFPASCPWVTSVGGTQMLHSSTPGIPTTDRIEKVYRKLSFDTLNTSGGGFSNVFSAPPYQAPHIASYNDIEKDHWDTIRSRFNNTGRGFPDVSARADSYLIALDRKWEFVSGTSASSPVFASIITLINSERMNSGKGPVGFINPVLYAKPDILNDVMIGSNEGCGINEAFRATGGWDAVTGLGTPNYKRMRDLFMSLP